MRTEAELLVKDATTVTTDEGESRRALQRRADAEVLPALHLTDVGTG